MEHSNFKLDILWLQRFMTVLGLGVLDPSSRITRNCISSEGERQKDSCLFLQVNCVWEAEQVSSFSSSLTEFYW